MADHCMTRIDPRIPCTDPRFNPVPAAATDVRRTWKRAAHDIKTGAAASWPQRYFVRGDSALNNTNDEE